LRDLRRIHSHICSVAYPVLDAVGELTVGRFAERSSIERSGADPHPGVSNVARPS
jgi:phosphate:Na+ symporter